MSQSPSRTIEDSTIKLLRKPILIAGLLGGFLGGVLSIAATRFIKPAVSVPPPTAKEKATAEARGIVEAFLEELKVGTKEKNEEFWSHVKMAYTFMTDELFKQTKTAFDNYRLGVGVYGSPLHDFELLSETAVSPNLVQFVYLERFERGALVWRFIMYKAKDYWRIALLDWTSEMRQAFVQ
jgi:hypothetical protein